VSAVIVPDIRLSKQAVEAMAYVGTDWLFAYSACSQRSRLSPSTQY